MKPHILRPLTLFLALATFCAPAELSFILTNQPPARLPRRPNLILILTHGLGYRDLSCYGQTNFQTPNLDQLAAEGIRFTNFSAGHAASSATRAGFLLIGQSGRMQPAEKPATLPPGNTIMQFLKMAGYHTGLIGEWDLGDENSPGAPWKKGFDEFAGYLNSRDAENYYADYIWRYAPKSLLNATNNQLEDFTGREMLFPNIGGKHGLYIPDVYTKAAINFINNNQPDEFNRHRPFFLLLDYATPRANTLETKRTGNGLQVPTDAPFSDEPWPQPEKNKAAMIARLDDDLGKLLEQLRKIHQDSNTVIFFSNVGLPQKAGGTDPQFFKSQLATNDLRLPLIIHWPGKILAGQTSGFNCAPADFPPTAAIIAWAQPPTNLMGAPVKLVNSDRTLTDPGAK